MSKHESFLNSVNQIITEVKHRKIGHLSTGKQCLTSNIIPVNGHELINFGSCSYLGLEFDDRLKNAAKNAIDCYGTQFSASRAYMSCGLYDELEEKFRSIFNAPSIVSPTTTLGHIATIPTLVNDKDAVILDHQVHSSVQNAVSLLKPRGIKVEMIRHNNMEMLEEKITELSKTHTRIWYMADGIYSMYGDGAPLKKIEELLNKYDSFHFYVDDAHGMSCFGKHGSGYVMENMKLHPKMVMAVSLAKAFATGGSVLVFPDAKTAQLVRNCGGPLITSGPMQPAALGAAIASANIHLSPEIKQMQATLHENIHYTNDLMHEYNLPLVMNNVSPVFFIGVGLPKVGYNLIQRLMNDGFYTNIGIFPAVPLKNTGVRFTITRLHTKEQIKAMADALKHHLPQVLEEENYSMEAIYKSFQMKKKPVVDESERLLTKISRSVQIHLSHSKSISEIEPEWNKMVPSGSMISSENLLLLEKSFTGNKATEANWEFDYLTVRDENNHVVACTMLTTTLVKDDMMSDRETSRIMESIRVNKDKYYMTSKYMYMGTIGTEGEHLFIDKEHIQWKEALRLILNKTQELGEAYGVSNLIIRDFDGKDTVLTQLFMENGYIEQELPENNELSIEGITDDASYFASLSSSQKKHYRYYVKKHEDKYDVVVSSSVSEKELEHLYRLYVNVQQRSLDINTFAFPFSLFKQMNEAKNWEIIQLKLKEGFNYEGVEQPIGVMFNCISGSAYHFVLVGIDYTYQEQFMPYKQAINQVVKRAISLGCKTVHMGFTTSEVKRKFGAQQVNRVCYVQTKDHFAMEAISAMSKSSMS
ncbi:MAG: aminotransferase class I/II-fold pyridoxal phosphate-dependent enzyme [Flavobacteriales bacterium]